MRLEHPSGDSVCTYIVDICAPKGACVSSSHVWVAPSVLAKCTRYAPLVANALLHWGRLPGYMGSFPSLPSPPPSALAKPAPVAPPEDAGTLDTEARTEELPESSPLSKPLVLSEDEKACYFWSNPSLHSLQGTVVPSPSD